LRGADQPHLARDRSPEGPGCSVIDDETGKSKWTFVRSRPPTRKYVSYDEGIEVCTDGQQDRRCRPVCKTWIPGSNPGGASNFLNEIERRESQIRYDLPLR